MSDVSDAPPIPGSGKHYTASANCNTVEYLSWRRLHLSKSKLDNASEMSSFMAAFAVVNFDNSFKPNLICEVSESTFVLIRVQL